MSSEQAGAPIPSLRKHYGIAEIADTLGIDRQLVTVWRRRRSRGMPEPDDELAAGPLWLAETIEPWITSTRERLELEGSYGGIDTSGLLPTQALRRYLRLTALLLEDKFRPNHAGRAARDLGELAPALHELMAGDAAAVHRLDGLAALAGQAGEAALALADGDEATRDDLLRRCVAVLPTLGPLGEHSVETRWVSQSADGAAGRR